MTLGLLDLAFVAASAAAGYDVDAQAYITAVEAADTAAGQSGGLELAVKDAINAFVIGCKIDNVWDAIKTCCILSGARTLSGALVPLIGSAPTNTGFTSTHYSRTLGLLSASGRSLDTNWNMNSVGQNDIHASFWCTSTGNFPQYPVRGAVQGSSGTTEIARLSSTRVGVRNRNSSTNDSGTSNSFVVGFIGTSRSSSSEFEVLTKQSSDGVEVSTIWQRSSQTPYDSDLFIFNGGTQRMTFYSGGQSLGLALLSRRVATLMADFTAAGI